MKSYYLSLLLLSAACGGAPGQDGAPGRPGEEGPAGPPGAAGADAAPTAEIHGVFPSELWLGKQTQVAISADGIPAEETPTIELDPSVAVVEQTRVSPTTIYLLLSVSPDAPLGPRTITLRGSFGALSLADALTIRPSATVRPVEGGGALRQGSFALLEAQAQDPDAAFDCSASGGLFSTANAALSSGFVYFFGLRELCTPSTFRGLVLISPLAPPRTRIDVVTGSVYAPAQYFFAEALDVSPAPPIALGPGEQREGQRLGAPLSSASYSVRAPGPGFVRLEVQKSVADSRFYPMVMALNEDGSFRKLRNWQGSGVTVPVESAQTVYYLVYDSYFDGGPSPAYEYRVRARFTPVDDDHQLSELSPDQGELPRSLDGSAPVFLSGSFAHDTDVDRIRLHLGPGRSYRALLKANKRAVLEAPGQAAAAKYFLYDVVEVLLGGPTAPEQDLILTLSAGERLAGPEPYLLAIEPREEPNP